MDRQYEIVIGLETHVQLRTESKIFSGCPAGPGGDPNTRTDAVTLGLPGVLPVVNREVVAGAVRLGLALGCSIRSVSRFARKHYFYPDLPKGYQITQGDEPICEDGLVDIPGSEPARQVRIERIHMEEDAGKTIHDAVRGQSLVDYNRAGTPLLEIVTHPDLRGPAEAMAYLKELYRTVDYLGLSDLDMESGNFRFDANISLRPVGSSTLGTKVELKNMNSFRNAERALEAEVERQTDLLNSGGEIVQETRLWNESRGCTESMRSKESAPDYRYFPEPDLPPVCVDEEWLARLEAEQPELPHEKRKRLAHSYELPEYDIQVLTDSRASADFFEAALEASGSDPKTVSNWLTTELFGLLGKDSRTIEDSPVNPAQLGGILRALTSGKISGKMAKSVLDKVYRDGGDPADIIASMGAQISDDGALRPVVNGILDRCPDQVDMFKAGKEKVIGFLMGQVMRETKGKANPGKAQEILREELGKR